MKRFHFQLQSALVYRQRRMEAEQVRMEDLRSRRLALLTTSEEWERRWQESQQQVLRSASIENTDLLALDNFHRATERRKARIGIEIRQLEEEILAQQRRLMEATRQFRLLEKLRQRRQAEWSAELDRVTENEAADFFLARWGQGGPDG